MTPNTKKQIWEALQAEMQTPGFTGEFDKFKRAYPKLRQFDTPQEFNLAFSKLKHIPLLVIDKVYTEDQENWPGRDNSLRYGRI